MSSWTYWVTCALADRGHEIHIITDSADVEPDYSSPDGDISVPYGIFVHRASASPPWHVPNERHRAIALLDEALKTIGVHRPDALLGVYLVPYGIVAGLAGALSGNRWYQRPGSSDIFKFYRGSIWELVLRRVLAGASRVITDSANHQVISPIIEQAVVQVPFVPPPSYFSPVGRPSKGKAVLGIVGKINYHWQHKRLDLAVRICEALNDQCTISIQAQGAGVPVFRTYMDSHPLVNVTWKPFVPPTKMPGALRALDAIFYFTGGLPFPSFSNVVIEALCCGTMVINDCPDLVGTYRRFGLDLSPFRDMIIQVAPERTFEAARTISEALHRSRSTAARLPSEAFESFITEVEEVLFNSLC